MSGEGEFSGVSGSLSIGLIGRGDFSLDAKGGDSSLDVGGLSSGRIICSVQAGSRETIYKQKTT